VIDYGIAGEAALVLGGTRGLGLACAESLVAAGVHVAIAGRDEAVGRDAAARIGATFLHGDVAEAAELQAILERAGPVAILVTNAGGPPPGRFLELEPERWEAAFRASVMSALAATRHVLPAMTGRGFGRIVNITSFVVKEPYPNMTLSNTVRVALTGAMASLSREVVANGVTINNILPGLMDTGALHRVIKDRARRERSSEDEVKRAMAASVPAGRLGRAEDFGPLCAFLCSRHAGYITGQNICVDGGLVRSLI
jgi:3-oxoacyl-[acyl-carrier protein] reductase